MADRKINKRGLTSFFTLFGFIIMSITGLVLYVVPEGRVAFWIIWKLLGLTKTEWGNIHILSSLLFIVAGAFHTYFNWKPLMNYFKDKVNKGLNLRRELVISSLLSVVIVVGSIWPFPPLSYLLDFNAWLKTTWIVQDDYEPPFGHAELLSLATFSKKMDIDLPSAAQELKANGIEFVNSQETLEEIAVKNKVAPVEIYRIIKMFEPAPDPEKLNAYTAESIEIEFAGTGIGNQSLVSVCEHLGLDTTVARTRLSAVGAGTDLNETMKNAATNMGTEPIELMKVLLLDGYMPLIK
jgi:hypothetical protein